MTALLFILWYDMNLLASQILERFSAQGLIVAHSGPDPMLRRIAPIEECQPGDLVFIDHAKYLDRVRSQHPSGVVISEALAAELTNQSELAILTAPNVRLAMAILKQTFADRDVRATEWPRLHPSAIIHATVSVPADAVIGPGVVIGREVRLGARVVLMANVVIEHDAVIGANTNIDRATYGATHIHAGAVIDAMCHLGHNVEIGEDSILCAHTGLSGSTRFGKRVVASGQTGTLDHVSVPDDTFLLHRAGLNNSIKAPGAYAGGPAQPLQQYLKNMAVIPKLHEMWTRLKRLEKKLAELTQEAGR